MRDDGYYFVRYSGQETHEVAYWGNLLGLGSHWYRCGEDREYDDHNFDKIGSKIL